MTGRGWSEPVEELYNTTLRILPNDTGVTAVRNLVLSNQWPPQPNEIISLVADLELRKTQSSIPSTDDAWSEVTDLMHEFGDGGVARRHFNPATQKYLTLWYPGAPPISHPVISRTIDALGGWVEFVNGDLQYQEGGRLGQFRKAYERQSTQWQTRVIEAIQRGPDRPAELFSPYVRRFKEQTPLKSLPGGIPEPSGPLVPCPESTRDALASIGLDVANL